MSKINRTIVNPENILKRNCNKLKKMYREAIEYEQFKKDKQAEQLRNLFKSIGNMSIEEKASE